MINLVQYPCTTPHPTTRSNSNAKPDLLHGSLENLPSRAIADEDNMKLNPRSAVTRPGMEAAMPHLNLRTRSYVPPLSLSISTQPAGSMTPFDISSFMLRS
jgi:hypothetical protein